MEVVIDFKMKYNLRDLTPESMQCLIGSCPAIYELTPKDMQCAVGACSAIYRVEDIVDEKPNKMVGKWTSDDEKAEDSYLIIGERTEPSEFGLEEKVGKNEVLIRVPKKLIDDMGK
ncbi:hypothetical protein J4477_03200 [Candidatus Pacearchaeota archaeon]|nr:hypothetical protein [uncultured archaeon]MBS3072812.1 hypothetical protein [Candidatus Pacearchaeota archaeon]